MIEPRYICKDCRQPTKYDDLTAGRCPDCHRECPTDCGGCTCFVSAPCTHCTDHMNEGDY